MAKTPHSGGFGQKPPTKEKSSEPPTPAQAKPSDEHLGELVANLVANSIVKPLHFERVEAVPLFGNRFRVNVYTTHNTPELLGKTRLIAKSYFVVSNGITIIKSDPPLV